MTVLTDKAADSLIKFCRESDRLSKLSDKELIQECIDSEKIGDDPLVAELINRLTAGEE